MYTSVYFRLYLWAFSLVFCVFAKETIASPLDEFVRETSRVKQRIVNDMDSFLVKCKRLPSEDVLRSRYSGGDIPLVWELGWQGQYFYAKRTFFPTEAQKKLEDIFISEEPTTLVLKKGALLDWHEGLEKCYVDTFNEVVINMINEWDFFEFLGYNVAEKIIDSSGVSYNGFHKQKKGVPGYDFLTHLYLPETIVSNRSKYSVRQERETIDGHDCFVIEWKDRDMLWVDPNHHWVLRRRTTFTDNQHKKNTINYQDYREIEPNVWFPFKLSIDVYANTAVEPKENWGKVAKRLFFEVQELSTAALPDSFFDIIPPPGTLVIDGIRGTTYTIWKEGTDPFAGAIELGVKPNHYVVFRAITIIIGSILIFIAVWRMLRNREGK